MTDNMQNKCDDIFNPCTYQPGDIVIDTDYTFISLANLRTKPHSNDFNCLDILALFSLSEAIVLNERVLTYALSPVMLKYYSYQYVIDLMRKGILRYYPESEVPSGDPDEYSKTVWKVIEPDIQTICPDDWFGYDFTLAKSLRRAKWASDIGIDHLVWPAFGSLPRAVVVRPVRSSMQRLYSQMKDSFGQRIGKTKGSGLETCIMD